MGYFGNLDLPRPVRELKQGISQQTDGGRAVRKFVWSATVYPDDSLIFDCSKVLSSN